MQSPSRFEALRNWVRRPRFLEKVVDSMMGEPLSAWSSQAPRGSWAVEDLADLGGEGGGELGG